jgi:hypothetical protein
MGLRKWISPPGGDRKLQIALYAVLGGIGWYLLPTPALVSYDAAHTSLLACATGASMALVLFREQR